MEFRLLKFRENNDRRTLTEAYRIVRILDCVGNSVFSNVALQPHTEISYLRNHGIIYGFFKRMEVLRCIHYDLWLTGKFPLNSKPRQRFGQFRKRICNRVWSEYPWQRQSWLSPGLTPGPERSAIRLGRTNKARRMPEMAVTQEGNQLR